MKLVYKLGQKYFNIKNLREVSEIKIVNKYDEQELQKKQDQEIDSITTSWGGVGKIRLYFHYSEDCEEISIQVDGTEYTCRNWEVFENNRNHKSMFPYMNDEYRVTKEKQKEFNKFKKEAKELLKAFKEL